MNRYRIPSAQEIDQERNRIIGKMEGVAVIAQQTCASTEEIAASAEEMSTSTIFYISIAIFYSVKKLSNVFINKVHQDRNSVSSEYLAVMI